MDRSNSTLSLNSNKSSSSAPFAYQTRLLERTSSTRSTASVSRSNSILTNPTGGSASNTGTRRWTPSHRVANSLDLVRGKWEERARDAALDDSALNPPLTTSPTTERQPTPVALKRRTLPSPIIATPLSLNTTGITVEDNSASDPLSPNRIHLPSYKHHNGSLNSIQDSLSSPPSSRHRSDSTPTTATSPIYRRPTSLYGAPSPQVPDNSGRSNTSDGVATSPTNPGSVMSPSPYRSSYMQNKKSYGDTLRPGRKLGNHLPRIASGDGQDEEPLPDNKPTPRHSRKARNLEPVSPRSPNNPHDVTGIPGRVRFSRDINAFPVPAPSSRLVGGLWADVQRHLLQAYEYLCHVGEAQQWIEGCLNEELGFGVVEMEDGLRNGVVLAKLVRHFQREPIVRKIYEAPKLDFRHSDNINYFFVFVRQEGLPEDFIFELTDLYEKKNVPKVIYCIHALSHLLARRGRAERIGNLLGRLKFTDDQLQKTQKGLKDSGIAMPNFGNIGKELAKDLNEEPDPETEDERRDRLLLENESSIIAFQSLARKYVARREHAALLARMILVEPRIRKIQAYCAGLLLRRKLARLHSDRESSVPWAIELQATARGILTRKRLHATLRTLSRSGRYIIKIQAQARGALQRRRFIRMMAALRTSSHSIVKLQSLSRACLSRRGYSEVKKTFSRSLVLSSVVAFQACARGVLTRRTQTRLINALQRHSVVFTAMEAHCRGVILRRKMTTQLAKLEDVSQTVFRIQAAARTYLARKRLLILIRGLRKATPHVISFQACARAVLARQEHQSLNRALSEVKTLRSVSFLQAMVRASLSRNRHKELARQLEFAVPDVTGLQAAARGALVRSEYYAWRDHLQRNTPVATLLQALLRGATQRRSFRQKLQYFRNNLSTFVKIQSLFRAKETREQYRQLTLGKNVTVGTIKNFVHLLDDSETDFQEELKVERLRKQVVESIRENQMLENEVNDLDVKIALVVHNAKEDVSKARRRDTGTLNTHRTSLSSYIVDPFSGSIDQAARRKLELYQQLFYLLQSHPQYLSKLFLRLSEDDATEKNRRFTERVVLTLFGYGQDRREDFLLLKLFQLAIHNEITSASSLEEIADSHPMYINIALHYARPKQASYVRETFQAHVRDMTAKVDLDLEADPCQIYRSKIDMEERKSGRPSGKEKQVTFHEALKDGDTRATYIRHLQVLQAWTDAFADAIVKSTKAMPYSMRYLARESLAALRERFPDASDEAYSACLGRLIYYRYLNPALITPEVFDIVPNTVDVAVRKNLHQVSKVLTQVTSGSIFGDDTPCYIPINDFVAKTLTRLTAWLIEVANVPDAETQLHAHEFLDATVQPKPIYISPNEIYSMHSLLIENLQFLAPASDDTLRVILSELNGVPNLDSHDMQDSRDKAITLELTNRFANVEDPHAEEKTLWVQAKRGVLAILRVQPAQDLWESLMRPVTEDDEFVWSDILEAETEAEFTQMSRRQPSTAAADSAYRLEDIRSLNFTAVKSRAIENLLELERRGKISRNDGFQGILNAIASDVRSKHRKRLQRQQEMESMTEALQHLAERKRYFEEQINTYHSYVDGAMQTMQRGPKTKKRFVIPFTKQYYHLRDLQKAGDTPQFGSYLYSAKHLYEKRILLSIDSYSPRQFDKLQLTISSNEPGIFTFILESTISGTAIRMASEDLAMEKLLQAKYEKRSSLALFKGQAKFDLELLLYQINKKFFV